MSLLEAIIGWFPQAMHWKVQGQDMEYGIMDKEISYACKHVLDLCFVDVSCIWETRQFELIIQLMEQHGASETNQLVDAKGKEKEIIASD